MARECGGGDGCRSFGVRFHEVLHHPFEILDVTLAGRDHFFAFALKFKVVNGEYGRRRIYTRRPKKMMAGDRVSAFADSNSLCDGRRLCSSAVGHSHALVIH